MKMRKVTIYTTTYCGYCKKAKSILERLQIPYDEVNVEGDDDKRAWLVEATGQTTVPQIFFDQESIGGCSELQGLEKTGALMQKLNAA